MSDRPWTPVSTSVRRHANAASAERRLEIDQHEAHLMHLATEVLTGQAVGDFMGRRDDEEHRQGQRNRGEPVQAGKVLREVAPIRDGSAEGQEYESRRERHEARRKEEPYAVNEAAEVLVRVEQCDPQV